MHSDLEPSYTVITPEMSVITMGLIIIGCVMVTIYVYVLTNMEYIKKNWDTQRCRYGIVIGDNKNLNDCAQHIVKKVVDNSTKPIYIGANLVTRMYTELKNQVGGLGTMLVYIKNQISSIFGRIIGIVYNLFIPLQVILTTFMNMFSKIRAIMIAQLYFLIASLTTMKSFMAALINAIIIVMMALAALIIAMMIVPFGWGVALAFLAIFVSISIPLGIFVTAMSKVINLNIYKIPKKPNVCFDKYTMLSLKNGTNVPIYLANIGDILQDGSIITSTLILSGKNTQMYYLNGIFVTGTHLVQHNTTWISVENHPNSIYIPEYHSSFVYCINTDTGILKIGETIFTDWNEMLPDDFILFPPKYFIKLKIKPVTIDTCCIGDVLKDGRIITGIAKTIRHDSSNIWYHLYYDS